jgi:hypothetical protein
VAYRLVIRPSFQILRIRHAEVTLTQHRVVVSRLERAGVPVHPRGADDWLGYSVEGVLREGRSLALSVLSYVHKADDD